MTRAAQVLNRELDLYNEFWAIAREGQEVPEPKLEGFVVLNNTPGYLPEDDDPPTFETYSEAWAFLVEEVQRFVEDMTATVISHPEFGYVEVEDGSLGRVFFINSLEDCG